MKATIVVLALALPVLAWAAVIDKVVAYIDDEAITQSELEERYSASTKADPAVSREEVLGAMINKVILLREVKNLRIEAQSEEAAINEYIDLKVRAFIRIDDSEIENFYKANKKEFKGKKLMEVKDKIETYLVEKEINRRLRLHIEMLKSGANIKILR